MLFAGEENGVDLAELDEIQLLSLPVLAATGAVSMPCSVIERGL